MLLCNFCRQLDVAMCNAKHSMFKLLHELYTNYKFVLLDANT